LAGVSLLYDQSTITWLHIFKRLIEVALMKIPVNKLMYVNKPNKLPCKVCEIPFMNESFVFTIILPDSRCMDTIESMLTYEVFDDIVNRITPKRLNMVLPKFQIYDHLDYKDLFNNSISLIDFSKIKDGLGINKSTYKSYIRLCEKGIEASCCTAFSLSHDDVHYTNMYTEHPCEDFYVDKQ
jgi:serine protease inhibitor